MFFFIWSGKEKAWWRPEGGGYTKKRAKAGVFTADEVRAYRLTPCDGDTPAGADMLIPAESGMER